MSKKQTAKRRSAAIYATTANEVDKITISVNPATDEIEFHCEIIDAYSEISYDRAKGPKVLSNTPLSERQLQFDQVPAIEKNYDFIAAIDTNTSTINGHPISVSGIIFCEPVYAVDVDGNASKAWRYWTPFCIELMDVRSKPENTGWALLINYLESTVPYKEIKRIGLIVDSDLENLKTYNNRTTPIIDKVYVPMRMQLIYASGERAADLLANQMLRLADKTANMCLDELQAGRVPLNQKRIRGAPYSACRLIFAKGKDRV